MPYRTNLIGKTQEFVVTYYLSWDSDGSCDVFWSRSKSEAEAEAAKLNDLERLIEHRLNKLLADLPGELAESPNTVLLFIQMWATTQQSLNSHMEETREVKQLELIAESSKGTRWNPIA